MLSYERLRDPVHGFIEVSELEMKIIDSKPFQRLRNIKQLAFTYLVYHGAEHTRFGHSLGVMHLATKAFRTIVEKNQDYFKDKHIDWYEQILRLIALTHDLGHAPFSHASESVFPPRLKHEDFTYKIIKANPIADIIREIGSKFVDKYGIDYNITPELICDIYAGNVLDKDFILLNTFMDSELDCDKMDYLLRDSIYCGVNYGRYDVERLINSLTLYFRDGIPSLAIESGGVQSFEEFVLARYFMFVQVYFHRTRRYFDILFSKVLPKILPGGTYPEDVNEYLKWDDNRVINLMHDKESEVEEASLLLNRIVASCIYETKVHPNEADKTIFEMIRKQLESKIDASKLIYDYSADKMPHKIPTKMSVDDERAIIILKKNNNQISTISEESHIIKSLTESINIERMYVDDEVFSQAKAIVEDMLPEK